MKAEIKTGRTPTGHSIRMIKENGKIRFESDQPTKEQIMSFTSNALYDDEIRVHLSTFNTQQVSIDDREWTIEDVEFCYYVGDRIKYVYGGKLEIHSVYPNFPVEGIHTEKLEDVYIYDELEGEYICLTDSQKELVRKELLMKIERVR